MMPIGAEKRTVWIGYGNPSKYGIERDDPMNIYFDREQKDMPLSEWIKVAQRMRPQRIVCELE